MCKLYIYNIYNIYIYICTHNLFMHGVNFMVLFIEMLHAIIPSNQI